MKQQPAACACGTVERLAKAGLPLIRNPLKGAWVCDLGRGFVVPIGFCCTCGANLDSEHRAVGTRSENHWVDAQGTAEFASSRRDLESNRSIRECACGTVERMVDAGLPLVAMPLTGAWAFDLGSNLAVPLTFCFACGGVVAGKRRTSRTIPAEAEMQEATRTLQDVRSVQQLEATFGPPDEVIKSNDFALRADALRFNRQLIYTKRWESFDLIAIEKNGGTLMFIYRPKIDARHV